MGRAPTNTARWSSGCLWAVILSLGMAGCASDIANRYYADQRYSPRPVDEVEILFEAPSRSYEVIADFQSRGESPKQLRARAAEIGADAVIVTPLGGSRSTSDQWADIDTYSKTYTRIVGSAIRYK